MAKAKAENQTSPEVKGETVKEEGKTPLVSPQGEAKAKEKYTMPNGTLVEHY